jgi:hypothetical protein
MLGLGMSLANIRHTKKCDRCSLRYPHKAERCTHCTGLSDHEVEALKDRAVAETAAHRRLGMLMWSIAVIVAVLLLLNRFAG